MLNKWMKIFPVFVVELLAKRLCERFVDPNTEDVFVCPFEGVEFLVSHGDSTGDPYICDRIPSKEYFK